MRFDRKPKLRLVALVTLVFAGANGAAAELTEEQRREVEAVGERFVEGWLLDSPQTVTSTLAPDAVLMPHHGAQPVVGEAAIHAFWWPADGPPVRILSFAQTYDEIGGNGDLAYARGRFELRFEFDTEDGTTPVSNEGNYLMLLAPDEQGKWRITHRIWNDPLAQVD